MSDPPRFPWLRLIGSVVSNIPAVKQALGETLSGVDRHPEMLRFVESFQRVDQKDCLICLAYDLGRQKGVLSGKTPEHWCPTRENRQLCGCGKPGTRQGHFPGMPDRQVCEEFPGCLPTTRASSKKL